MTLTAWVGTVLAYGTTGRAARRFGAGDRAAAVAEGVQASWLALGVGLLVALGMQLGGGALARTLAGALARSPTPPRSGCGSRPSAPPACCSPPPATAGCAACRTPAARCCFVLGPNLLSALLCPLLVYPGGLGLVGSAVANAIAQTLSGGAVRRRAGARAGVAAAPPPA